MELRGRPLDALPAVAMARLVGFDLTYSATGDETVSLVTPEGTIEGAFAALRFVSRSGGAGTWDGSDPMERSQVRCVGIMSFWNQVLVYDEGRAAKVLRESTQEFDGAKNRACSNCWTCIHSLWQIDQWIDIAAGDLRAPELLERVSRLRPMLEALVNMGVRYSDRQSQVRRLQDYRGTLFPLQPRWGVCLRCRRASKSWRTLRWSPR